MAGFIQNILWNSVEGFVEAGTRSVGEFGGNALIKAGDLIENSGRSVGTGIEKKATAYGSSISGQSYQPSPKALPSTARKPVVKRSNSLPASSKPGTAGGYKYPGKNQVGAAMKTGTGTVGRAKSTAGGAAARAIPPFKGAASTVSKTTPSPYPSSNNSLPKPYGTNTFPSGGKKTAVRPGQIKPFVPPVEKKVPEKKAYPGQGSRTPVRQAAVKPAPRLGPQIQPGQKMQHIAI